MQMLFFINPSLNTKNSVQDITTGVKNLPKQSKQNVISPLIVINEWDGVDK